MVCVLVCMSGNLYVCGSGKSAAKALKLGKYLRGAVFHDCTSNKRISHVIRLCTSVRPGESANLPSLIPTSVGVRKSIVGIMGSGSIIQISAHVY